MAANLNILMNYPLNPPSIFDAEIKTAGSTPLCLLIGGKRAVVFFFPVFLFFAHFVYPPILSFKCKSPIHNRFLLLNKKVLETVHCGDIF